MSTAHTADHRGALFLVVVGLVAAALSFRYGLGRMDDVGPGFFPLVLSVILVLLGVGLFLAERRAPQAAPEARPAVTDRASSGRAKLLILAAVVVFIVVGQYGGLVPATFLTLAIAARADRRNTLRQSLLLAAVVTALAVAVFHYGLGLQFGLFVWG